MCRTAKRKIDQLDAWTTSRAIARSRLPQIAATIPTLGYVILWSDEFDRFLKSTKLDISFGFWRLQFIWWGAVLLLIGLVIYWLFCPRPVQRAASAEDYLDLQFNLPDAYRLSGLKQHAKEFVDLHKDKQQNDVLIGSLTKHHLAKAANTQLADQTRADLLRFDWEQANRDSKVPRRTSVIVMLLGAVLFLIPSLDVSLRVLALLLKRILGL